MNMDSNIATMLSRYQCRNAQDYEYALKEIIQETALSGLARGGFFKQAAFTGGTALRIFYNLPRFSEDLDFSLILPDPSFQLSAYLPAVKDELASVGFQMEITSKKSTPTSPVQSAFLKGNTLQVLLKFTPIRPPVSGIPASAVIRIKLEIDTNPPAGAQYEEKSSFLPHPYIARLLDAPSLLATKLHAVLARKFLKGRDFYDYIFYLQKKIPVNLILLENALRQTGQWTNIKPLAIHDLQLLLIEKFKATDFQAAKTDVAPFIRDTNELFAWSKELFVDSVKMLCSS